MARVKGRKLTDDQRELAGRVAAIRTRLGLPRRPLSQPELYQALRKRFGVKGPSLSTVKGAWGLPGPPRPISIGGRAARLGCRRGGRRGPYVASRFGTGIPAAQDCAVSPRPEHARHSLWIGGDPRACRPGAALPMVGRTAPDWFDGATARAVEGVIRRNELDRSREGRRALVAWLLALADYFERHGLSVVDLRTLAAQLRHHI
jgi:hypothetical protein